MRIGVFGGSFDPVHYGHLLLAECCREQARLDAVWFTPAAVPPHKQGSEMTPAAARAEMLELAIGGHEAFSLCRYEIDRGGVNYTVDTLAHVAAEDPDRELFFLMGGDSLADLPNWKDPARLCELALPVVVRRAGGKEVDYGPLAALVRPERMALIRKLQVDMPLVDLSGRSLRERVARGQSIRYRTPRAVEKYIETAGLYRLAAEAAAGGRAAP